MVSHTNVEKQLERAGAKIHFFAKPEVRELASVLVPGEIITSATTGYYNGGYALLCATDYRVLLVDKKPWFLNLEDIRYDMITEVDYNYRILNATVHIHTVTKALEFKSWNQAKLRKLTGIVQEHLMKLRMVVQQAQQQQERMNSLQLGDMSNFTQPQLSVPAIGQVLMRPRIGKFTLKTLR